MSIVTTTIQPTPTSTLKRRLRQHPLIAYFVLAFAESWLLVLPMTLSRNFGVGLLPYDLPEALALLLVILASFIGPTVAAIIVTAATEGRASVWRLLKRCIQWRVGPQWYLVALGANLTIWLLGYSAVVGPGLLGAAITHWSLIFTAFLPYVAFGLLIPAIGEEPGWRGFALPRLQQRYGPLAASLILGTLHGVWHVPALFTALFGPVPLTQLVPFILTAAFATVLYTWIYNHTGGSILIAMLIHASGNAATQWLTTLLAQSGVVLPHDGWVGMIVTDNWINVIAYGAAALLIVALTRGRLGYVPDGMAQSTDARTRTQAV